ncbi:MAG: hypothetical protein Q9219_002057 [cf. Caloplaca sp. 3 TL-2023]
MQLRSGTDTKKALARKALVQKALVQQDKGGATADLFPAPDPETPRTSAQDILLKVQWITIDPSLSDEDRLLELHKMLKLCAEEQVREAREYQAVLRHFMELGKNSQAMFEAPKLPESAFVVGESPIDKDMRADERQMAHSRTNAATLLETLQWVEYQVMEAQKEAAFTGKTDRLFREMNRFIDEKIAKSGIVVDLGNWSLERELACLTLPETDTQA